MSNKYHAQKTQVDGVTFHSKKEANRYGQLKLLLQAGEISGLELQPQYPLEVNGQLITKYIGDFRYREKNGDLVLEDVKGTYTPIYRLKKKLVKALYGIEIKEV